MWNSFSIYISRLNEIKSRFTALKNMTDKSCFLNISGDAHYKYTYLIVRTRNHRTNRVQCTRRIVGKPWRWTDIVLSDRHVYVCIYKMYKMYGIACVGFSRTKDDEKWQSDRFRIKRKFIVAVFSMIVSALFRPPPPPIRPRPRPLRRW